MGIKSVKPKNTKYRQGYYTPENPKKYVGNLREIIYRSSWERKFMIYCDRRDSVIKWSSETLAIPYYNPIVQKQYMYYPDFLLQVNRDGKIYTVIVEIKPSKQTQKPVLKGNKERMILEYNNQMIDYIINISKWQAAKKYADANQMQFVIMTEKELY